MGKMVSVSFYYGGIDLEAFELCFGSTVQESFPEAVSFVLEQGLMRFTAADGYSPGTSRLQLTAAGKRHFGGCVGLFYSPAVQDYLMGMGGGEIGAGDPLDVLRAQVAEPQNVPVQEQISEKTVPLVFEQDGESLLVNATLGAALHEVAKNHGLSLEAACRGECACSTCHVKLPDVEGRNVPAVAEQEQDMLDLATGSDATSRLACQLRVTESLRGARIQVPGSARRSRADKLSLSPEAQPARPQPVPAAA